MNNSAEMFYHVGPYHRNILFLTLLISFCKCSKIKRKWPFLFHLFFGKTAILRGVIFTKLLLPYP